MGGSLKEKVSILICWALVSMCSAAEEEYFSQSSELTWEEARSHCQACFKDLVTLTPENIQTITRTLTSGTHYWVGLRKNVSSTSNSTSSMSWSHWANGDPLAFQNWYPGWPVFKSSFPERDCCSCSCTCPATTFPTPTMTNATNFPPFMTPNATTFPTMTNATNFTPFMIPNVTNSGVPMTALPPVEASCVRSPLLPPYVPDTDKHYIEDSCVAMLSFGAWVEKNCSERLHFICYENRFIGQVNVTNVTNESADLTWLPGPGNITQYRLEVKGDKELTENLTNLTYECVNLTAGTYYSVQVFPIKCTRDLSPQEVAFYTRPNKVENLQVTKVTETSVSLRWSKTAGNVDFYLIEVRGEQIQNSTESNTEGKDISNLTPGSLYTFTVISGVMDKSRWSEESNITKYTKPAKVSKLTVSGNTNNSLLLEWMLPEGNATGFRVTAMNGSNDILFREEVKETSVNITELPQGTRITLSVTALANGTEEGDEVTVFNYTAPGPISNLNFLTTFDSLNATWTSPGGNNLSFIVKLQLDGKDVQRRDVSEPKMYFDGLKTATNYTVIVYSVSGHLRGPPVESSNFTLPLPPTNLKVSPSSKQITLEWRAPLNITTLTYSVKIYSSFWSYSSSDIVKNTSYTFYGLQSGTKYDLEVRTIAHTWPSAPLTGSHFTDAVKKEISLSMICSSGESLCDQNSTKESVFNQLYAHFNNLLGDNIIWKLDKRETEN